MRDPSSHRIALRGGTLAFRADPFVGNPEAALAYDSDGAVVVAGGLIVETGPAHEVLPRHPGLQVEAYPGRLILAGFIDTHTHYAQQSIIGAWGASLLDWLDRYTFPAEITLADPARADRLAEAYLDASLAHGITTSAVYGTVHAHAAEAFFAAAHRRGLRMVAGKVLMDRNAPAELCETAEDGYRQSEALITRWHGTARLAYAISPRFAPTSSPAQLEAAGALWRAHPSALMQTHLAESPAELAWVARLFPDARDYLDVYERHGLVGPGAIFGHAIHLSERERRRLAETGSGLSHCPTSNTFLGSGLFDLRGLRGGLAIPTGVATDIGAGTSLSMLDTLKAAYEVAALRGERLHPAEAFYLATQGGADVLQLGDRIGNLVAGREADIVVLDPASHPLLAERCAAAGSISDVLFALMILGDHRAVEAVYSGGRIVSARAR